MVSHTPGENPGHATASGIALATQNFHQKLNQNLEVLKGMYTVADDIPVTGEAHRSKTDHDYNLPDLCMINAEKEILSYIKRKNSEAVRLLVSMAMYPS